LNLLSQGFLAEWSVVTPFLGSRSFGWRIHCGVEVTESSTNKQHTFSQVTALVARLRNVLGSVGSTSEHVLLPPEACPPPMRATGR